MPGRTVVSYNDHDGERSTTTFYHQTLSAANYDGLAGVGGSIDTLIDAIAGIANGAEVKRAITARETSGAGGNAAGPYDQRETKWLVTYSDNTTGKVYQMEIPCADLTLKDGNTPYLDVGVGTAGETFVNAFESTARSPTGGQVTVLSIRHVGRNL